MKFIPIFALILASNTFSAEEYIIKTNLPFKEKIKSPNNQKTASLKFWKLSID